MRKIKTVSLIGLGAIGSFLAVYLKNALEFEDLRIIAGGPRQERLLRDGIIVNDQPYHFHVVSPEEETGPADLAILITKFNGLEQAAEDMKNQIGPETIIMAPLNGVEAEELIARIYGWNRVIYSLARVSVVMKGNKASFNPNVAHIEYGEKENEEGNLSERVQAVKDLFDEAGIRSVIQKDMIYAMWHKFMCNVSENQSAAVLGTPFGGWRKSEHIEKLRHLLAMEVIAVAAKKGIVISPEEIDKQGERLKKVPFYNKPSTLQDLEAGRKTEVDIFSGAVIRMGKELGVATPVNEIFYHAIKALEEKNDGMFIENDQ